MTNENGLAAPAAVPYPGSPLRRGDSGDSVKLMQFYLDSIREYIYPSLGFLTVDGIFGAKTEATVKQYQLIKGLTVDGVIGLITWNAIVADYDSIPSSATDVYPGKPLSSGSTGIAVVTMQTKLDEIVPTYTAINLQTIDGKFGTNMSNATRRFQRQFGLVADEVIGEKTWYAIVGVHKNTKAGSPDRVLTKYPGTPIMQGDSGDYVRFVQSYMNKVGTYNGAGFPKVTIDGIFGTATKQLVLAFQKYFALKQDGIVGQNTFTVMVEQFNRTL